MDDASRDVLVRDAGKSGHGMIGRRSGPAGRRRRERGRCGM